MLLQGVQEMLLWRAVGQLGGRDTGTLNGLCLAASGEFRCGLVTPGAVGSAWIPPALPSGLRPARWYVCRCGRLTFSAAAGALHSIFARTRRRCLPPQGPGLPLVPASPSASTRFCDGRGVSSGRAVCGPHDCTQWGRTPTLTPALPPTAPAMGSPQRRAPRGHTKVPLSRSEHRFEESVAGSHFLFNKHR